MTNKTAFDETGKLLKAMTNVTESKTNVKERVLTSVSGGQAAASWPYTGCLPAAGSAVSLASPGCHSNDT